jgi:hypothetical protein
LRPIVKLFLLFKNNLNIFKKLYKHRLIEKKCIFTKQLQDVAGHPRSGTEAPARAG